MAVHGAEVSRSKGARSMHKRPAAREEARSDHASLLRQSVPAQWWEWPLSVRPGPKRDEPLKRGQNTRGARLAHRRLPFAMGSRISSARSLGPKVTCPRASLDSIVRCSASGPNRILSCSLGKQPRDPLSDRSPLVLLPKLAVERQVVIQVGFLPLSQAHSASVLVVLCDHIRPRLAALVD